MNGRALSSDLGRALGRPLAPTGGLAAYLAAQADGFWFDFGRMDTLFQDGAAATPVTDPGDVIGRVIDRRIGPNSPRDATQPTTSFKPKFQSAGATFDWTDDRLAASIGAAAGDNFMVARVAFPASLGATQVFIGASNAAAQNFYLGLTAAGQLRVGAGNDPFSVGADLRGQTVVVGLTTSAASRRVFIADALAHESAVAGSVVSGLAWNLGSLNYQGSSSNHFGGSIRAVVAGRSFIDLATFNRIAAAL